MLILVICGVMIEVRRRGFCHQSKKMKPYTAEIDALWGFTNFYSSSLWCGGNLPSFFHKFRPFSPNFLSYTHKIRQQIHANDCITPFPPKVTNSFLKSRIYRIYRIHRIYRIAASAKPAFGDGELLQNNNKIGCANLRHSLLKNLLKSGYE